MSAICPVSGVFQPTAVAGSTKYGARGLASEELFAELDAPSDVRTYLANLANHGIAGKTWASYRTAKALLEKCELSKGKTFEWPLSQESILTFIDWLIRTFM